MHMSMPSDRIRRIGRGFCLVLLCGFVSGCTPGAPFGILKVGGRIAIVPEKCRSLQVIAVDIRTAGKNGISDDSDDDVLWSARSDTPASFTPVMVLADLGPGWVIEGQLPTNVEKRSLIMYLETDPRTRPLVAFNVSALREGSVRTWNRVGVPLAKYSGCAPPSKKK
jgi:hypothetical protein